MRFQNTQLYQPFIDTIYPPETATKYLQKSSKLPRKISINSHPKIPLMVVQACLLREKSNEIWPQLLTIFAIAKSHKFRPGYHPLLVSKSGILSWSGRETRERAHGRCRQASANVVRPSGISRTAGNFENQIEIAEQPKGARMIHTSNFSRK
jgi:hypothetical protein